ncbi:GTPase [Citrobacter freundii]|nr:GTPase [Citrobacter freundii]
MSNGKDPDPEIAALAARITQLEKRLDGEKKTDYSTFPEI